MKCRAWRSIEEKAMQDKRSRRVLLKERYSKKRGRSRGGRGHIKEGK